MSRTHKTAPYAVKAFRRVGKKAPKNWRELSNYRSPDYDRDAVPDVPFWRNHDGFYNHGSGYTEFRRDLNREYRNKAKQTIRDGYYDEIDNIPDPVRNALWYWY